MRHVARLLLSEDLACPQVLEKSMRWENHDSVLRLAPARFERNDKTFCKTWLIFSQGAQPSQMVAGNARCCLGFNRCKHITNNEIDLDSAGQTPIAQRRKALSIGVVR